MLERPVFNARYPKQNRNKGRFRKQEKPPGSVTWNLSTQREVGSYHDKALKSQGGHAAPLTSLIFFASSQKARGLRCKVGGLPPEASRDRVLGSLSVGSVSGSSCSQFPLGLCCHSGFHTLGLHPSGTPQQALSAREMLAISPPAPEHLWLPLSSRCSIPLCRHTRGHCCPASGLWAVTGFSCKCSPVRVLAHAHVFLFIQ